MDCSPPVPSGATSRTPTTPARASSSTRTWQPSDWLQRASAANEAGVDIVLNARIDVLLTGLAADPRAAFDEILRRAHRYAEAGADCVYPIRLTDPDVAAQLARALPVAVNANLAPSTTVADLAAAGVKRISVGPMAHAVAMDALSRRAGELLG